MPCSVSQHAWRAIVVGALVAVLAAGPVLAQDEGGAETRRNFSGHGHVDTGGYLVIGGLTAFDTFERDGGQDFDDSLGFLLKGGARLNPYFAAELEGNFVAGFDTLVDVSGHPNFPGSGLPAQLPLTVDGGNLTLNAVAYYPLGRLQPKAIVGLGGMWARLRSTNTVSTICTPTFYWWYCTGAYAELGSDGGFVMRFGGGLDIEVAETWAVVIESTYVMPFGSIEDLAYVNLNWGVRFDF